MFWFQFILILGLFPAGISGSHHSLDRRKNNKTQVKKTYLSEIEISIYRICLEKGIFISVGTDALLISKRILEPLL